MSDEEHYKSQYEKIFRENNKLFKDNQELKQIIKDCQSRIAFLEKQLDGCTDALGMS